MSMVSVGRGNEALVADGQSTTDASSPADVLVTIVVAAFNVERYIDQCLDSIEAQTHDNLEIIVVDDGSTDDTRAHLSEHAEKDPRVRVIAQENSYAGVARNNGLDHAGGAYVICLDSDDFFEPQMIETMLASALATNADVVLCRSNYYDVQTGEVTPILNVMDGVDFDPVRSGTSLGGVLFQQCFGWAWDKLYRTDFINGLGLRFQDLRTTNDAFFGFMSMALADRIAFIAEPLVFHRINNPDSLEATRNKSWDNALTAAMTIQESLVAHGVYDDFKQSYLNWLLTFFMWNFETLDDEARDGLIAQMRKDFVDLFPENADEGFYLNDEAAIAARILQGDATDATKQALLLDIDLARKNTEAGWMRDDLARCDELIQERDGIIRARDDIIRERDESIGELEGENKQLVEALRASNVALVFRDESIMRLREDIADREEAIYDRDETIHDRDRDIERLEDEKDWIRNSTTFKVGHAIMAAPCAIKRSLSK